MYVQIKCHNCTSFWNVYTGLIADISNYFFSSDVTAQMGTRPPLLNYEQREKYTPDRTLLQEWSTGSRTATYTTHNKQKRRKSVTSAGFEPAMPATNGCAPTPWTTQPLESVISALRSHILKTWQSSKYGQMPDTSVVFIKHKLEQYMRM